MASERDTVLSEVVHGPSDAEPNMNVALSTAEVTRQLEISNAHEMEKLQAELGWFGKVFGSESHAAIVVAFVVIVLGFGTAIGLWITAGHSGRFEFWASEAHLSLAAATSALGYVFGRGSRDRSK